MNLHQRRKLIMRKWGFRGCLNRKSTVRKWIKEAALNKVEKHFPEDKGIGDVVARLIGDENGEQFKSWYKSTFNKDCGCKGRQARWNHLYPLK